jgi:hypothetical protein
MPKSRLNDFSTTADDNTDISGIGIQGNNLPSNLDNAIRALMAQIAAWREGTSLEDSATFNDPTDSTKVFRFDGANIPTGTTREIDAEKLFDIASVSTDVIDVAARRGAPTITAYTASGTHTFDTDTNYFMVVAIGAGGGSGAVDGQGASTGGCSAGGNSGFHGRTAVLAKGALTTGTIVIGAAGAAGVTPSGDGGDGGDTTWTDATNGTLTWQGGKGSVGITASANRSLGLPLANDASTASLIGSYNLGGTGNTNSVSVSGGLGASSPWGTGGIPTLAFDASVTGVAGSGYGAGGAGAAVHGVISNVNGGAGTAGRLEVWEW